MRIYKLDLETLLALLEELGQNGSLFTELPTGVPGLKERCQAGINLREGKIVSCSIEGENGQARISGDQALLLLFHLGSRDWSLLETPPDVLLSHPAFVPAQASPYDEMGTRARILRSSVPQRIAFNNQQVLNSLSRQRRRVINLIDGVRSVEKIASLLFSSSDPQAIQAVGEVLRELEAMGMITMGA